MIEPIGQPTPIPAAVCQRALDARDARFDGLFFVGIVTTHIYCRPTCPSRRAVPNHRRFFDSAAAAEHAGFRPCLRCRPELAPGKALADSVSRLAEVAARRIGAGALNGRSVSELARELHVSARHLRRALRRELGVSPLELAQTHRLLLAKRLLADTALPVIDIAYASGFESLRRFNVAFRDRYGMSPRALRKPSSAKVAERAVHRVASSSATPAQPATELLRMTLAYRPPLAWDVLLAFLRRNATPGVELVLGRRYGRTVRLHGRSGIVLAEDSPADSEIQLDISPALLPALMPLLARMRHLFDLDAQPGVVDELLERSGLATQVARRRGVRLPAAFDGFEAGLRVLLEGAASSAATDRRLAGRIAAALGEPIDSEIPALNRLAPDAARVIEAGVSGLAALGVPPRRAATMVAFARAAASGALRLDPGGDLAATERTLAAIPGLDERLAKRIVMRAVGWPDSFPESDRALQRAAGCASAAALHLRAEAWRPWRAYAAMHLWLEHAGI